MKLHLKKFGHPPRQSSAVFCDERGKAFERKDISKLLATAAEDCGLPKARYASHSLRRGGASAYAAAGLKGRDICRFGRWTSEAYEAYVYDAADKLDQVLKKAVRLVPRFERN